MSRSDLVTAVVALWYGAGAALAGPLWLEDEDGGDDAGSVLQTSQDTTGAGPLTGIKGRLDGLEPGFTGLLDFEDAYLIFIEDPAAFSVTTAFGTGMVEFDSRVYLFDMNAQALLGNDDTPISAFGAGSGSGGVNPEGSSFENFSTDGTGIVVTEPGVYLLAITFSPNVPTSNGSGMFLIQDPAEVSGPDGPAPDGGALGDWFEEPTGACELFGGKSCFVTTAPICAGFDGEYLGDGTTCGSGPESTSGPGTGGDYTIALTGATFANAGGDRPHPGWNWVDVGREWTANQPAYWSALTGQPGPGGGAVPPFTILDPSADPLLQGRPATDGTDDRVLRGFIYAWAVDDNDAEISWNHLKGDATIVNYRDGAAWEYNAWAFQAANDPPAGAPLDQDFRLDLDGTEYVQPYALVLLDFYAPLSVAFGGAGGIAATLDTRLTLHHVRADLRQEGHGPYTTKASFVIWNEDETQFTNLHRCITCWDQQLLSLYTEDGIQNHFLSLQTDKGKARIDGIASLLCSSSCCLDRGTGAGCDDSDCQESVCQVDPFCCIVQWDLECAENAVGLCDTCDSVNIDAPLLGVAAKEISLGVTRLDGAGTNLVGMGVEDASVYYDQAGGNGGEPPALRLPGLNEDVGTGAGRSLAGLLGGSGGGLTAPLGNGGADRVSGTEKGSLLIFSNVEIRWSPSGAVIQDTFIDLTNDFGANVRVKMYFVNGDPPTS